MIPHPCHLILLTLIVVSGAWAQPVTSDSRPRVPSGHSPSSDVTGHHLSCQGWPTPWEFETEAAILASSRCESLRSENGCFGFEFWPVNIASLVLLWPRVPSGHSPSSDVTGHHLLTLWVGPPLQNSKPKQPFSLRSASNRFEARMAASVSNSDLSI